MAYSADRKPLELNALASGDTIIVGDTRKFGAVRSNRII